MNKASSVRGLFTVTIGLEVHTELLTNTKMFSTSPNVYGAPPNVAISELDLGYPGSMPVVNRKAVELAIILGNALSMDVDSKNVRFDRKHYFYHDLPKGYQITQFYYPIGKNGKLFSALPNGSSFEVDIERIHLEEDSAKIVFNPPLQGLDYNRAGVPLLEIVTRPCLHEAEHAMAFLGTLKRLLQFKRISNARMEEGSLRCDVNVSVAPTGAKELGVRTEVKNLNSIANVGRAIDYEVDRQIANCLANRQPMQETRRWDEKLNQTVFMREKTDAIDYRYITEPNLPPLVFSDHEVGAILDGAFKDPTDIRNELIHGGLSASDADNLLNDFDLYARFDFVCSRVFDFKQAYKWVCVEAVGQLARNKRPLSVLTQTVLYEVALMITAIQHERINSKQAKEILNALLEQNTTFEQIMATGAFNQINDEAELKALVEKVVGANPDMVFQFKERPERAEKFFVGLVMKETGGQANPVVAANLVKAILSAQKL